MQIESRQQLTAPEWDTLVNASSDGWVFSLWGWQELIESVDSWALEDHSFAIKEGSRLLAVVPLHYHPASASMGSSGWGGSGPVIDARLQGKSRRNLMDMAIQHGIRLARSRNANRFEIPLSPVTGTSTTCSWGVNPLVFHGLDDRSGLAQVVDLARSDEQLWAELSADARRQIKRARDAGIRVEPVDWTRHLERYYDLHVATYKRTGVSPHPRAYFEGIAVRTAVTGHSVLWAAFDVDRTVLAYHNMAKMGSGASYHTGCSAVGAGPSGASYLLFWEAMLGARRDGVRWYDCGAVFPGKSASEKQKGLSAFKNKFGGEPHRQFVGVLELHASEAPEVEATSNPPGVVKRLLHRVVRGARTALTKPD
jgi:hypothetical protein